MWSFFGSNAFFAIKDALVREHPKSLLPGRGDFHPIGAENDEKSVDNSVIYAKIFRNIATQYEKEAA